MRSRNSHFSIGENLVLENLIDTNFAELTGLSNLNILGDLKFVNYTNGSGFYLINSNLDVANVLCTNL